MRGGFYHQSPFRWIAPTPIASMIVFALMKRRARLADELKAMQIEVSG
jgi:hypothetical protein